MNFDETIEFLTRYTGSDVWINVAVPEDNDAPVEVACVVGEIDRVSAGADQPDGTDDELWRVWIESEVDNDITLRRSRFVSAEVVADPPVSRGRDLTGVGSILAIRQAGVIFEVLIYR